MRFIERRPKVIKTMFGDTHLYKYRFHCDHCRKGVSFYPLGNTGLSAGKLSSRLAEIVCLLAAHVPFETASDLLKRMHSIEISTSTIKEISEKIGNELFNDEKEQAQSLENPVTLANAFCENKGELSDLTYVQVDGAMINTVDEWKENKLGIIFNKEDIISRGSGEKERLSIQRKKLVTSLAHGVDDFKARLKLALIKSKCMWSKRIIFISDGAIWIENLVRDLLPGCTHVLDWFHVTEHLWKCAKLLYGENSEKVRPWVEKYKELLMTGKVGTALDMLLFESKKHNLQTPILELHSYFKSRVHMMQYDQFLKEGIYIGSGAIEAANKYAIQNRLKKCGMKWSISGANVIAKLRTNYLSDDWDSTWRAA